jgi:hypothetical protein
MQAKRETEGAVQLPHATTRPRPHSSVPLRPSRLCAATQLGRAGPSEPTIRESMLVLQAARRNEEVAVSRRSVASDSLISPSCVSSCTATTTVRGPASVDGQHWGSFCSGPSGRSEGGREGSRAETAARSSPLVISSQAGTWADARELSRVFGSMPKQIRNPMDHIVS